MTFSDLGLSPDLLRAVEDAGYTTPTPIQEQAIPNVLMGRDVLGCAQTGTGKTASFTLPMIEILAQGRARARMPRSLILEPTRELAAQVAENFELYGKYNKLSMALLIGGESFTDQVKKLDRGVDVLIATPGRMIDLFERGNILLSDIKILVIDEADRMLDMGFIPDIERIVSLIPKLRQTLMFSATMPPEIRRLADQFLMNPREITVSPPASPAMTVTQALAVVHEEDKRKALRHILKTEDVKNAFIFCNRKKDVSILFRSLERHGFNCGALHGDLPQHVRTETLEAFRRGDISLLVCSDVAARGIDIIGVSHVFNFDVPFNAEDYIHRIGRTGRAGRSGRAFTLATPDDGKLVAAVEKLLGREIPRIDIDGLETPEMSDEGDGRRRRVSKDKERGRKKDAPAAKKDAPAAQGRRRPRRSEDAVAEVQAAAPLAEVQAPVPDEPRAERPRPEHRERDRREGERRDRNAGGRRRDNDRRHHDDDRAEPVVGFGDHLPAFMLRRVRPTASEEA
ncbi:MAG TPA: DEAD/DEAH box helicase [Azospirillaceae bacterium]|nr:DEAD/DEAH box helicase [Azospirillaceae bacterium]